MKACSCCSAQPAAVCSSLGLPLPIRAKLHSARLRDWGVSLRSRWSAQPSTAASSCSGCNPISWKAVMILRRRAGPERITGGR